MGRAQPIPDGLEVCSKSCKYYYKWWKTSRGFRGVDEISRLAQTSVLSVEVFIKAEVAWEEVAFAYIEVYIVNPCLIADVSKKCVHRSWARSHKSRRSLHSTY